MALREVFVACLLFSAALGAPSAKDLVADVFAATRAVSYFDLEVNELSSRLYNFQSEVNLQVVGYVDQIRTLLQNLQVPNYDAIDTMFNEAFTKFNDNVEAKQSSLREIRQLLITITRNLENDLPALPPNADALNVSVSAVDVLYADTTASLLTSRDNIQAAMTEGIGDQESEDVTRLWVQWRHINDLMLNEQFLTDNVKLVYDVRAQDVFNSLNVVIGQIPPGMRKVTL